MAQQLPADAPMSNWLPVSPGAFNIMLRVYGPAGTVEDNTYVPPGIQERLCPGLCLSGVCFQLLFAPIISGRSKEVLHGAKARSDHRRHFVALDVSRDREDAAVGNGRREGVQTRYQAILQ